MPVVVRPTTVHCSQTTHCTTLITCTKHLCLDHYFVQYNVVYNNLPVVDYGQQGEMKRQRKRLFYFSKILSTYELMKSS